MRIAIEGLELTDVNFEDCFGQQNRQKFNCNLVTVYSSAKIFSFAFYQFDITHYINGVCFFCVGGNFAG